MDISCATKAVEVKLLILCILCTIAWVETKHAYTQTFIVGKVLPRIAAISVYQGFHIVVTWTVGSRAGQSDVIDLGPTIMNYKLYAPLRANVDLFRTVHVINYGSALGWGNGEEIDMSAEGVEDLAEQAMTAGDFRSFMERHKFPQDAAAAQLGISRRQVNYFLTSKAIPRTVALACGYLDMQSSYNANPVDDPKMRDRRDRHNVA